MDYDIVLSNKGRHKIHLNGYMYTRSVVRKTKIWWKCSCKASFSCRASLFTTVDMTSPENVREHNHDPDPSVLSYVKCRDLMRQQATNSLDKTGQIFAQTISQQGRDVQARLPVEDSVKRNLRYHRRTPSSPNNLQEFIFPDEWKVTAGSQPEHFLLYDNGPESHSRIIGEVKFLSV